MNSKHASRFPRFRVLISAKRSGKACLCTVMMYQWQTFGGWVRDGPCYPFGVGGNGLQYRQKSLVIGRRKNCDSVPTGGGTDEGGRS